MFRSLVLAAVFSLAGALAPLVAQSGNTTTLGTGCPTYGLFSLPPTCTVAPVPRVGAWTQILLTSYYSGNAVVYASFGAPASPPYAVVGPFGPCTLYLDPTSFVPLVSMISPGTRTLTIPSNPALAGVRLTLQALITHPGGVLPPSLTNAVDVTVGI